jgi:hypothetical protein
MTATLHVDADQIAGLVQCLFRYADPGTFVALRGFDQADNKVSPCLIASVLLNGELSVLTARATAAANRCAQHSPRMDDSGW